jgi:hypothetical protein
VCSVRCPRVPDRVGEGSDRIRFSSAILPPYARRSKSLERILREIRRRTRVVGAFPSRTGKSALNLAAANRLIVACDTLKLRATSACASPLASLKKTFSEFFQKGASTSPRHSATAPQRGVGVGLAACHGAEASAGPAARPCLQGQRGLCEALSSPQETKAAEAI